MFTPLFRLAFQVTQWPGDLATTPSSPMDFTATVASGGHPFTAGRVRSPFLRIRPHVPASAAA
jgi:hypothetical protein